MKVLSRPNIVAILLLANMAAHAETIQRTAAGESGKDIRVGVYLNIRPDCTSGPLPEHAAQCHIGQWSGITAWCQGARPHP
jgi:hypothetical protein